MPILENIIIKYIQMDIGNHNRTNSQAGRDARQPGDSWRSFGQFFAGIYTAV